jgi:hypothetical protein
MTRDELRTVIYEETKRLNDLFNWKNEAYGANDDALYNFYETARRVFGISDLNEAFVVLRVLADKHWVALCNRGLYDPEAEERLRDIAVYALIGIAMAKEHKRCTNQL